MSTKSPEWNPDKVAAYMAASLSKTARDCTWPDDVRGTAACLLIQDLGEFAETMVGCGRAGYWSPSKALQRLFMERVEILMGASVDARVAKRYLDTVAEPLDHAAEGKPRRRARGEDAFDIYMIYLRKSNLTQPDLGAMRAAWVTMKSLTSDWLVHPTALGPILSRSGRASPADDHVFWFDLILFLAYGCYWAIASANPLNVALHPQIIRAISAAAQCLDEHGVDGAALSKVYSLIAARVEIRAVDGGIG